VFNFSGSEIVFLLLLALIVLGPEKLPEAVRKFGKTYGEIKKMTTGFQSELKSALDEPMREMRDTADAFKKAASFDFDAEPEPAKPLIGDTRGTPPPGAAPPIQDLPVPDFNVMAAATPQTPADEVAADETTTDEAPADEAPADEVAADEMPAQHAQPPRVTPPRPESVPESSAIAAPMTRRMPSKKSAASFRRATKSAVEPAVEPAVEDATEPAADADVSGSAPPLAPREAADEQHGSDPV
jgi:sec-independent protein translocase protein TatB